MLYAAFALIGAIALNTLLVLGGRGSFGTNLMVFAFLFYFVVPVVLIGAVFTGFGKAGSSARSLGYTVLTIAFILGSSMISLPLGAEVNSNDIIAAKQYCEALVPRLQSYKETHGKYPSEILALGELAKPPELLRDSKYYWSDGEKFGMSFVDPAGMMDGWGFESTTQEWKKWN